MKIALVIDVFDNSRNGATVSARRFVDEKRKNGHDVVVITTGEPKDGKVVIPEMYIPLFQNLIRKSEFIFGHPDKNTLRKAFEGIDIVHLHFPFPLQKVAWKIAKEMKIPVIAAFHVQPENILFNLGIKRSKILVSILYRYMVSSFYNKFEHIHCPTQFAADQLSKYGCKANLHIISNGFLQKFRPIQTERDESMKGKFIILSIGRLGKEKNQKIILKAIDRSAYRDNIQLILIGKGPLQNRLETMGSVLPNKPIIGYQSDEKLLEYLNIADLYVHASDIELESISTLEAMACGLVPVISNASTSATKQFAIHENSLFKSGNIFDLTGKIDWWIENTESRILYSKKYLEESEKYRLDVSVKKTEKVYSEVIRLHKEQEKELDVHDHQVKVWAPLTLKIDSKYQIIRFGKVFNFFSNIVIFLANAILYPMNKMLFGFKIKDKKKLKAFKKQGYISVSNHCHLLDSVMVNNAVWPKPIYYPSLKINFEIPVVRHLLRIMRSFPIPPGASGFKRLVKPIGKAFEKGQAVHFFPEASLWPYHKEVRPFVEGAFYLAILHNVPVIPMGFKFTDRKAHWRKPKVTLVIGDPILPETVKQQGMKTREWVEALSEATFQAVTSLIKD